MSAREALGGLIIAIVAFCAGSQGGAMHGFKMATLKLRPWLKHRDGCFEIAPAGYVLGCSCHLTDTMEEGP